MNAFFEAISKQKYDSKKMVISNYDDNEDDEKSDKSDEDQHIKNRLEVCRHIWLQNTSWLCEIRPLAVQDRVGFKQTAPFFLPHGMPSVKSLSKEEGQGGAWLSMVRCDGTCGRPKRNRQRTRISRAPEVRAQIGGTG